MKTNFAIRATLGLLVLSHFICLGRNPVKDERSNQVSTITEVSPNGEEKIVFDNNPPGGGNSISSLRQADIVGSLPGTPGVSPSGAATYDIPIWVSPGTNGMQPKLSITYNSSSGDGLLGIGWGISGLSAITRKTRDYMHDPALTGPFAYSSLDRFQLDGNLMVMLAGSYYAGAGTQYQTENQTFSNIIAVNNIPSLFGGSPESFLVYRKDGTILQYGGTNDSRVECQGSSLPLLWQLNKITDANGNYMEYEYYEVNGESYIKEIRYTYNSAQGIGAYASVNFEYTNSSLPNTSYVNGVEVPHTKRLSTIYIKYSGNTIYKYTFNYGGGGVSSDHITSISYCDANNLSINSTQITWGSNSPHMTLHTLSTTDFAGNYSFYPGDYNGDGIKDLVVVDNGNKNEFKLYLFDRTGHYTYACTQPFANFQNAVVGDINGDGKDEFIEVESYSVWIVILTAVCPYSFNGSSFTALPTYATNVILATQFNLKNAYVGDFNGDGKSDIVLLNDNDDFTDYVTISFDNGSWNTLGSGDFSFDYLGKITTCNFNGDQITDLMISKNGETRIIDFVGNTINNLFIGNYPTEWHGILTGDFNGDGKTDLLTWDENSDNFSLSFSTGVLFTPEVLQPWLGTFADDPTEDDDDNNFIIGDYNGDGKDDILKCTHYNPPAGGSLSIFHSYGNGTFNQGAVQSIGYCIDQKNYIPGDFNGDGKIDIFNNTATPVFGLFCATQGAQLIAFHENEQSNLVQAITNGYDKTDNFSYAPLTELATNFTTGSYLKGSGALFPVFDYQGPMHVVNKTWQSDVNGNIIDETIYSYKGAKIHRQGRGFLCFKEMYSTKVAVELLERTTSDYNTSLFFPYITNKSLTRITNIWNFTTISQTDFVNNVKTYSNGIFFPYVENKTINDLLKNNKISIAYNINNDGNLIVMYPIV